MAEARCQPVSLPENSVSCSSPGAVPAAPRQVPELLSCPFLVLNTQLPPCGLKGPFLLSQAVGWKERAAEGTPIPRTQAGHAQLSALDLSRPQLAARAADSRVAWAHIALRGLLVEKVEKGALPPHPPREYL